MNWVKRRREKRETPKEIQLIQVTEKRVEKNEGRNQKEKQNTKTKQKGRKRGRKEIKKERRVMALFCFLRVI